MDVHFGSSIIFIIAISCLKRSMFFILPCNPMNSGTEMLFFGALAMVFTARVAFVTLFFALHT